MLLRELEGRAWELQYCERNFTFCLKHRTRAQETSSILGSRTSFQKPLSIFLLQPSHRCEGRRRAFPLYPSRQCRSAKCEQSAPHPIARLQQAALSHSGTEQPAGLQHKQKPHRESRIAEYPKLGVLKHFPAISFPNRKKIGIWVTAPSPVSDSQPSCAYKPQKTWSMRCPCSMYRAARRMEIYPGDNQFLLNFSCQGYSLL